MSHHANKYKLGAFVLIAFIVFLTSLFVLGALNIFKTRIHCMTVVTGSVQGLAVGAKVKYNGVPIGEVTQIKVSSIGEHVYIYMNIFPENLDLFMEGDPTVLFKKFVDRETKKGLRCQLRYEGITGSLYQELQYFKINKQDSLPKPSLPEQHPTYIPSLPPVLFDSILKRIDTSLAKLSGIDKIFYEVNGALKKINSFLDSDEIKNTLKDFEVTSRNINNITNRINKSLTEEKVQSIIADFQEAMTKIHDLAKTINTQLLKSNIPATSANIRDAIKETADKLNEAIDNFNSAANSIEQLSDELNSSPETLIWGITRKKVIPSH